ncbi:hypothetical protein [Pseudomonas aeruginosa]|nr:hypothetical protein [Pseudomonas aeruginosa]
MTSENGVWDYDSQTALRTCGGGDARKESQEEGTRQIGTRE